MGRAPPSNVEQPYRGLAWCVYGSLLALLVVYGSNLMLTQVFVSDDHAQSENKQSFEWGSMPSFVLELSRLNGTWAHVDYSATEFSESNHYYGFQKKGNNDVTSQILPDGRTMIIYTEAYFPTFVPFDKEDTNYIEMNALQLFFSIWLPRDNLKAPSTWLQAELGAIHVSAQSSKGESTLQPLVYVPLSLCSDKNYALTSISLHKTILERSCKDSFLGFSTCHKIQYEKEFAGQVMSRNNVWPMQRVPYGDGTLPTAPENAVLYCGSVNIEVRDKMVDRIIIPPRYLRFLKALAGVGGLFNYVAFVFALAFVPKIVPEGVLLTLRGMGERKAPIEGCGDAETGGNEGRTPIEGSEDVVTVDCVSSQSVVAIGNNEGKFPMEGSNDVVTEDCASRPCPVLAVKGANEGRAPIQAHADVDVETGDCEPSPHRVP